MYSRNRLSPFVLSAVASAIGLSWAAPPAARAGVSVVQLGEQDFADGTSRIYDWQIRGAGAGEPYPFNGTIFGDDRKASLGLVRYTHKFDLAGLPDAADGLRAAWLTIGAIDFDSPPGEPATVSLRLDGVPRQVQAFAGISSPDAPSSAQVVKIPVPVALLKDGVLTVELAATRHAPGFPGNSIEVDFSQLLIETGRPDVPLPPPPAPPPVHGVPLPRADLPAAVVLIGFITGYGLLRRMRRCRAE